MSPAADAEPAGVIALPTRGMRSVSLLVIVVLGGLALSTLHQATNPVPVIAGVALFAGVGLWISRSTAPRLPLHMSVVAAVTPIVLVLTVGWVVHSPGFSIWFLGAGGFLLFFLTLRGRGRIAWVSVAVTAVATALWGWLGGFGVGAALAIYLRQVAVVAAGSLLASGISRTQIAIARLTREGERRAAELAAVAAVESERHERLDWARRLAVPVLARLAQAAELDDDTRLEATLVEAELRDGLRARTLAREPVVTAARRARARGVEVLLLDDRREPLPPGRETELLEQVARELDATRSGRLVARLLPAGRDTELTIVVDGPQKRRVEL